VLVDLTHATTQWSYGGTLLAVTDAKAIHPDLDNFNGADLFAQGDQHCLVISPAAAGAYLGCLTYDIDLELEVLTSGTPIHGIDKTPDTGVFQTGACTFHDQSATGMIVGDT